MSFPSHDQADFFSNVSVRVGFPLDLTMHCHLPFLFLTNDIFVILSIVKGVREGVPKGLNVN
jgi:hypothetical protein